MNEQKQKNSLGIVGLILGIVGIVLSALVIGGIIGIIGIIFSIIAIFQKGKKKGTAIAGVVLNFLAIIIMIVVIAAGVSLLGGNSGSSDAPTNSNLEKVEAVPEQKQADNNETVQENDGETKTEFRAGDVIETSDLRISFISAEEYTSDNEFVQPDDGNTYCKMDFEFENISDSDRYVSSSDFKCYADGYDMEKEYLIEGLDLDATLSPGKKTKGAVFFEIPVDAEEITLEYETNFWTEDKIIFIIK